MNKQETSQPLNSSTTPEQSVHRIEPEALDESDFGSITELLETDTAKQVVSAFAQHMKQNADMQVKRNERTYELHKRRIDLEGKQFERMYRLSIMTTFLIVGLVAVSLIGVTALFIAFKDRPEIAHDTVKLIAAIGGAVGAGYGLARIRPGKPR